MTMSVKQGDDAILPCSSQAFPLPSYSWFVKGPDDRTIPILERDGKLIVKESNLLVKNIDIEDGRTYVCLVQNPVGSERVEVLLEVTAPLSAIVEPKTLHVDIGQHASLHCIVGGHPVTSLIWLKDGQVLESSQMASVRYDVLHINVITMRHRGMYQCAVGNEFDSAQASAEIKLGNIPPTILRMSEEEVIQPGQNVALYCLVSGSPAPAVQWTLDNQQLSSSTKYRKSELRSDDGNLLSFLNISDIRTDEGGSYSCRATNKVGLDVKSTRLNVYGRPYIRPMGKKSVVAGKSLFIHCAYSGYPIDSITWEKGGVRLPVSHLQVVFPNGTLKLLSVQRAEDAGTYACHVRNKQGQIARREVEILVLENSPGEYEALDYSDHSLMKLENGSLMLTNVRHDQGGHYLCHVTNGVGNGLSKVISLEVRAPVRLGEKVRNQTAVRGKEAKLRCFAQGDRPIRINWFRKQKKIALTSDDRMKIEHTPLENGLLSEITIKHSAEEDSSSYICAAENDFGKDEIVIHVVVIGSPEVPRELKIKDFLSRSVKMSWTMPHDGNSPIKDFLVILAEENTKRQIQNVSTPGTTNEVIIADLKPATTYQAKVLAANEAGVSEASDVISFTTMEEAPQGPPDNVKAEPTGNNAIKVTWKPPTKELRNGHIRGYNVGYKVHESLDPHSFLTVEALETDKQEMSIVLEDLRPFTQYNIVVQAFNQIGTGPQSNPVMVLTSEDVPRHPPRNLRCTPLSSQSLQLMWDVLPSSAANGILQGYKVVYQREDEWYEQEIHEIKVTVGLGTVISGLQKFSNYSVQVLAYTRVGDGMRSDAVICSTVEDVPEAPAHVKALANSIGSVIVSWSPPRRPNGILISYTVYMRSLDLGRKDIIKRSVSASETYHELSRLKINTRYEFWVTASTSLGEGQSTAVIAFSTAEGPLVAAKVVSFGESVIAAWQTSIKLPCIAVGIPPPEREWKFTGSIEKRDWTDVLTDGTLHLTNLQTSDGGNYTCRVSNSYGSDTISYTIAVQVPPTAPSLTVSSSTYTSMEVRWERKNDKIVIKGYYLYYKRDFGEWEEIYLGREHNRYLLSQLECGTRYQIYLAAFNKLGVGAPGDIILTKTKGSVPIQPPKHKFIQEEQTFVILLLEKWSSGGCPVLYFVVEYKPITKDKWKLVSNNVLLEQREFVIPDLPSASWFALRVTAHNNAGSTVAKYLFSTLNTDGGTIAPLANMDHSLVSVPTMQDLRIVIPLIIGLASIITICFLSWMFCKRKRMHHQLNNAHSFTKEQDPRFPVKAVYEKNSSAGSFTYLLDSNQKNLLKEIPPLFSNKPNKDNLSPYATSQISAAQNKEMTTFGQRKAPHVYPLIEEDKFNEVQRLDPRMKKQSQQLQVTGEPDTMYIHEYNRPVSGEYSSHGEMQPNLHVWNLRPGTQGYYDQHVPDLLDHHPDSSTSNSPDVASSPDLQSMRNTEEVESPTERRKRIKETRYPSLKYGQRSKETTYIFDNADNKEEGYEEEDISDGEYDRAHYDHEMSHQSPSKPVLSSKIHRNIRNIYDENTSVV